MDSSGGRNLGWNALIWVWGEGLQELGPGLPPADVAKPAAKILRSIDAFQNNFFERGAISQHLIKAGTMPPAAEKERVLAKLRRALFGGNTTAHNVEVVNSDIEVEKLGADPKDLSMGDIDDSNQRDISAAFLTSPLLVMPPETINRSALDRIQQDWLLTVIAPHTQLIVKALNKHLFEPMGYMLELDPQSMAVNQEDEKNRALSVSYLVNSGEALANAYAILGYDLPADYDPELAKDKFELQLLRQREQLGEQPSGATDQASTEAEELDTEFVDGDKSLDVEVLATRVAQRLFAQMQAHFGAEYTANGNGHSKHYAEKEEELGRLRRWARNRIKDGSRPDPDQFETTLLTYNEKAAVLYDVTLEQGDASGEDSPFPVTTAGKAIRDIPRDPLNPDGRQMRRFERRLQETVEKALDKLRRDLFRGVSAENARTVVQRLNEPDVITPFRDAITAALQEIALAGADFGREQVERHIFGTVKQAPLTIDWQLANTAAADWALQYSYELVSGLTDTTRERLQQEITRFIEEGGTMDDLQRRLTDVFGEQRASRIAVTEVTRAYQQGQEASRRATIEMGIPLKEEIRNAQDERVCNICGPLGGQVREVGAPAEHPTLGPIEGPPFHVGCRDWTVPVVIE